LALTYDVATRQKPVITVISSGSRGDLEWLECKKTSRQLELGLKSAGRIYSASQTHSRWKGTSLPPVAALA